MTDQPSTPARTPPVLLSPKALWTALQQADSELVSMRAALAEAREREINATMARQAAQDQVTELRKQLAESDDESNRFLRCYEAAQAKCAEAREEIARLNEEIDWLNPQGEPRAVEGLRVLRARAEDAESRLAQVQADHALALAAADEFRRLVLTRLGISRDMLQCPRAKSDMTPCVARDGSLATYTSTLGAGLCCVGCERAVSVLLNQERERAHD